MVRDKTFQKQMEKWGTEAMLAPSATDPKKQKKEQSRESNISVVKELMQTIQGREWIWEKLNSCNVFGSTFVPGKPDVSDYLSGRRDVGSELFHEINLIAPEMVHQMNMEAAQRTLIASKKIQPDSPTEE